MQQNNPNRQFTPLLPLLQQYLLPIKQPQELQRTVHTTKLRLALIEKSPTWCIADMQHSLQAIKPSLSNKHPEAEMLVGPTCRATNNFYCVHQRSWIALNARKEDLTEPLQHPHPYHPSFHFRSNYDEYRKEKTKMNYLIQCQVVEVTKWTLKIVNISTTGYYAPVLNMLEHRVTHQKFSQNLADVTSIIYEDQIRDKLQWLRLQGLRDKFKDESDTKVPWSMFFYCRHMDLRPKKKKNNIISIDKKQAMLNYDPERPTTLVPFGKMEGTLCLQYPINRKEIDHQKIRRLNLQDYQLFFKMQPSPQPKQHAAGELWSSSDEDEEMSVEGEKPVASEKQVSSKSESSDSEEDILKNLYMRQFQNLNIN